VSSPSGLGERGRSKMGFDRGVGPCEGEGLEAAEAPVELPAALAMRPLGPPGRGRFTRGGLRGPRWFGTKGFAGGRRRRGAAAPTPFGVVPAGEALILGGRVLATVDRPQGGLKLRVLLGPGWRPERRSSEVRVPRMLQCSSWTAQDVREWLLRGQWTSLSQ
jgi:hypothetical protein